jgi:CDP-glucose 4,6-dehydratase
MEDVMFDNIYKGKKVLVTGCCGFKGSWLVYWLGKLGAEVTGFGHLPGTAPNHHTLLGNSSPAIQDLLGMESLYGHKPDLVIHLAAKAIVAKTFDEPQETFENNVMGAVNILEACRKTPSVKGVVMIVTDKVYENKEWGYAYREIDELGGVDPYSASKVCVEHVIRCYRESFGMTIATARAGNVIGGGDWSYKRLLPDVVRAASKGERTIIHTPYATRPFQHVLDALAGYLLLGQHILSGEGKAINQTWNFGPEGEMSVLEVLQIAQGVWPAVQWEIDSSPTHPFMQYLLKIDSTKARKELGWRPRWTMQEAVEIAILWYKDFYEHHGKINSEIDIKEYEGG